jgi:hypothetical protein
MLFEIGGPGRFGNGIPRRGLLRAIRLRAAALAGITHPFQCFGL